MKRIFALLCVCLFLLTGCGLLSDVELTEPEPELPAEEQEPEEPEGSKALTLILAHEPDEGHTALLESAQQAAAEKGYTLSSVVAMGNPELQTRFLELARDAGEQAVLLELFDASYAASAVQDAGEMAVIFVDTAPESNSVLGKRVIYVGNADGEGELYLRLTGRTAVLAAVNLAGSEAAGKDTGIKLSGHKLTVPADGVLDSQDDSE